MHKMNAAGLGLSCLNGRKKASNASAKHAKASIMNSQLTSDLIKCCVHHGHDGSSGVKNTTKENTISQITAANWIAKCFFFFF